MKAIIPDARPVVFDHVAVASAAPDMWVVFDQSKNDDGSPGIKYRYVINEMNYDKASLETLKQIATDQAEAPELLAWIDAAIARSE